MLKFHDDIIRALFFRTKTAILYCRIISTMRSPISF